MMKKLCLILTLLYCLSLVGCGKPADSPEISGSTTGTTGVADSEGTTGPAGSGDTNAPTQPSGNTDSPTQPSKPIDHTCSFGDWLVKTKATCSKEGREERACSVCGKTESRVIAKTAHDLGDYNVCKTCFFVDFDPNADFVELGIPTLKYYSAGNLANSAWDIKVWNGRVYRGAGDYDKNSGTVRIFAYDIESQSWKNTGSVSDQAIHHFVEIDGKLMAPGIDPTGSWDNGNYYVLDDTGKSWKMMRNLPNGVHNFDMIEFDGKIFAGLGTEDTDDTVAVSSDGGQNWTFVPLYKDGKPYNTSSYKWTRTYEFVEYKGELYAMLWMQLNVGGRFEIFHYQDGKMVYQSNAYPLQSGSATGRNYWNGKFEFGGACYLTASYLYAVTDFSNPETYTKIKMPNDAYVSDAYVKDGVMYVLAYRWVKDSVTNMRIGYKTIIYKSTTGQAGSFEEVLSFDYPARPCSFDFDGTYYYIGTSISEDKVKDGMVLRVKPAA